MALDGREVCRLMISIYCRTGAGNRAPTSHITDKTVSAGVLSVLRTDLVRA
jgi:hypothetical protein